MSLLEAAWEGLRPGLPLLAVVAVVIGAHVVVRHLLEKRLADTDDGRFRIQLVMIALSLAGVLAIILALPVSETLRGQLLSLLGILLSASIALSATTFLGNALAGVLLQVVGGFRLGDLVRVGEHFGRVSERGLFHTEIQTEERDLTTLPNLYLVSNPVRVVRSSGTIVAAHVSLGYDVSRERVERLLVQACEAAGLEDPFVHVDELGDFSVSYRAAGLLTEVKQLLSVRSRLRGEVLDALHEDGIEIVSPNFMNTRALAESARFVPRQAQDEADAEEPEAESAPEEVIFDKAEEAETEEQRRRARERLEEAREEAGEEAGETAREEAGEEADPPSD